MGGTEIADENCTFSVRDELLDTVAPDHDALSHGPDTGWLKIDLPHAYRSFRIKPYFPTRGTRWRARGFSEAPEPA